MEDQDITRNTVLTCKCLGWYLKFSTWFMKKVLLENNKVALN